MQTIKDKKISIGLLLLASFLFLLPLTSHALTISPPRVELEADPGVTISGKMKLINGEESDQTFYSSFENFEAKGETGVPSFIESKEDLAGWMSTNSQITVKKGEEVVIDYSITVPKNAEPGGHFAAIFWNTTPPQNSQIAVGAKIGMLVLLKVSGPIKEGGGILEFSTKNNQKFFTSLPVNFFYRFQNSGADRAKPKGEIKIKNILGITSNKVDANPVEGNILPNSIRRFEMTWENSDKNYISQAEDGFILKFFNNVKQEWHNFAFGRYKADLNIVYGSQNIPAFSSVALWVFPWHLLLITLIIVIAIVLLGRREISKYNKWVVSSAIKNFKSAQETIKKIGGKPRI